MADEVLELFSGVKRVVDGTAGGGGHVARFLEAGMQVLAVDRDPDAIHQLRTRFDNSTIDIVTGTFDDPAVIAAASAYSPEAVLLDLGVSSHQLDDPTRGFTFKPGATLDMRMGQDGPTAAELLNHASADALTTMFREYADERRARNLAREIERRRASTPLETSDDLVNAIRAVLGKLSGPADFARIFQAVRIEVNDELGRLDRALEAYRAVLPPHGVLAVITYHSGEDRLTKHTFREWARDCVCPPQMPVCGCRGKALGTVVTRKPIGPADEEVERNGRARSAKLRAFRVAA